MERIDADGRWVSNDGTAWALVEPSVAYEQARTDLENSATAVAIRQADTNRTTIDAAITAALVELDALIAAPAVATVPGGTLTTAQLSNAMRDMRDAVQANRAGAQKVAATLKRTIRLVRGDFDDVN